jgi:hypothetical protein
MAGSCQRLAEINPAGPNSRPRIARSAVELARTYASDHAGQRGATEVVFSEGWKLNVSTVPQWNAAFDQLRRRLKAVSICSSK